jgi:hypothetical protein
MHVTQLHQEDACTLLGRHGHDYGGVRKSLRLDYTVYVQCNLW